VPAPDSRRTAILGWTDADSAIYIDNESSARADANMDMNSEREDYSLEIRQLLRDVLQAAVGGEFSAHREFPCLHVKTQYDGFTGEGGLPLYPDELPAVFLRWAGLESGAQWEPEDFLVLDLETTGLSRGQTIAFLIGLGYWDGGRFTVEQIFLPEPEAEANSFDRLIELLETRSVFITFNGKTFDIPVLESRILYNHLWIDLRSPGHIDLLHIARRLWKKKIPSCALETIEFYIMDYIRDKELDIDGGMIPQTYYQYLVNGDPEPLRRVFIHNQFDILHTAALFALICNSTRYPLPQPLDHRIDYVALARLYQSQGERERAKDILLELEAAGLMNPDIAYELGMICKKEGEREDANRYFAIAASLDHPEGTLEYCMALEKAKEFDQALFFSQKLLAWHLSREVVKDNKVRDLQKRIARLRKKLMN